MRDEARHCDICSTSFFFLLYLLSSVLLFSCSQPGVLRARSTQWTQWTPYTPRAWRTALDPGVTLPLVFWSADMVKDEGKSDT